MTRPSVLISDKLSPRAVEIFERRGVDVDLAPGLSPEELAAKIGDYQGLAIRSATKVTAELLEKAAELKVVGRAGIGVDNVDLEAATAKGVVVMNTPFGNSTTTAEHAIAMMMALARKLPQAHASTKAGKWEKSKFTGVELAHKTLGLIGCGNIGQIVANRAQGLAMRVVAYDPFLSLERARDIGVEKVELEALLARADVITLHTPLTEQTRNILGSAQLAAAKDGVRIVNCARGGLIDERALLDAIQKGKVAGAALDVFEVEPARDNPLFALDQVIATPHLGAATAEAQENVALQVADQMADYLLDGAVSNALNAPSVSAEEAPILAPYLRLAEVLGSFAGQLTETGISAVSITYAGQAASLNTKPLTATALAGLLQPQTAIVNMVNATKVAESRHITVRAATQERIKGYESWINLEVMTERGPRNVAGALFQGRDPRLIEIAGIRIDAGLGRHMLFVRNHDKPGFIGALGAIMGEAGVNIASFHLGRHEPGGDAIALVEIDAPPTDAILEALRALPQVVQAKSLRF